VAQAQAPAAEVEASRGAFGQRTGGGDAGPQNRSERRAQERKGR
jgi:preprotein translocase subunit SecA